MVVLPGLARRQRVHADAMQEWGDGAGETIAPEEI
jgi:hypothetical protein